MLPDLDFGFVTWGGALTAIVSYALGVYLCSGKRKLRDRLHVLTAGIEHAAEHGQSLAKDYVKDALDGDTILDSVLDKVAEHATPRVSKLRKIGGALLDLVPVVGQLRKLRR